MSLILMETTLGFFAILCDHGIAFTRTVQIYRTVGAVVYLESTVAAYTVRTKIKSELIFCNTYPTMAAESQIWRVSS